jgi:ankyrin repeat protein
MELADNNGQTALHIAASYGRHNIVDYFVEKGMDIMQKDKNGQSAIDLAIENEHYEIAGRYVEQTA